MPAENKEKRDMVSHRKSNRNHYRTEKPISSNCVSTFHRLPGFLHRITAEAGQRLDNSGHFNGNHSEDKTLVNPHFCHRVL